MEELHEKVATEESNNKEKERMRQNEVAETEKRSEHLRMIALEKIVSKLESIEDGLGRALAGLGRRNCSQELPRPRPQSS